MLLFSPTSLGLLTQRDKSVQCGLVVLLALVISGIGYTLFLKPKWQRIENLALKEKETRVLVRGLEKEVLKQPEVETEYKRLLERLSHLSLVYFKPAGLAEVLASVSQAGQAQSLTFLRMDWGESENVRKYRRLPLHVEFTGRYIEAVAFIRDLTELPYIVHFEAIEWRRVKLDGARLHIKGKAYIYQGNKGGRDAP
ncbi:type 4a pilus biogenesis protein PilO [Vibrio ostreicida]|uniref:type 4a pilus biogenesis protein PilO n=1 Tax=Vibrio ostreicida TaxID=526588 RepID=UPI0009705EAE|nr:type 4a pilus biogenesis protein PilO [Vibrio ostreicida]